MGIADMLIAHDMENRDNATSLLEEALSCMKGGGVRPDAMPREWREAEDARDDVYIPHAGQQEMELNPSELQLALEQQLALLRNVQACMGSSRDTFANGALGAAAEGAPFVPPARKAAAAM